MINITFRIFLLGGRTLDDPSSLPEDLFNDGDTIEGALLIFDNGVLTNEIEDELPALVQNLCFNVTHDLQQQDRATYDFFGYYGQIDFLKQGDKITLSGTGINTVTYETDALLTALRNSGEHFMRLLQELKEKLDETSPAGSILASIRRPEEG